jgi:murein DD-endopeptidase MepM/ murein hydrolase activator NlpD
VVKSRLAIRVHAALSRAFPERRIFLRSDTDTRFIRLRPGTQAIAATGGVLVIGWTIVATSILLMDEIGAGSLRDQALREQTTYQQRLNALAAERDARAAEAASAQERFNAALAQISTMQSALLEIETERSELESGIDVLQRTLGEAIEAQRTVQETLAALEAEIAEGGGTPRGASEDADNGMLAFLTAALNRTAEERDQVVADAAAAVERAATIEAQMAALRDENERVFQQLEEAMTVSVEPLDKMFEAAGMDPDRIIRQVRNAYSGQGGPLMPLSFSTRSEAPSENVERANRILNQMDRLNLYRIAAEKAPFAVPLKDPFRFTSGFGYRWGRLHAGTDFAAPHGTPIYATADGVVTYAGWLSGYGRLVKIQHDFGIETRYAHNSRLHVKVGDRVSRGDQIADMGSTGRSTGTHLHYEVRVGGKPVNPMIYIKAANDVF